MKPFFSLVLLLAGTLLATPWVQAETINMPLQLNYGLLNTLIGRSLYTGAGNSVELWRDGQGCSSLSLADLHIDGQNQLVRLRNAVAVKIGAKLGGQCIPVLAWQGTVESLHQPTLAEGGAVLALPVSEANAYDAQGHKVNIKQLDDLLKRVAEPKLSGLRLDLRRTQQAAARTLGAWLPATQAGELSGLLSTLKFNQAEANDQGIALGLTLDVPAKPLTLPSAQALSATELKQWQPLWQGFEQGLTKAITGLSKDGQHLELAQTLKALLPQARRALHAGLTGQFSGDTDPVQDFFSQSWQKIAPSISQWTAYLPGWAEMDGLSWLAGAQIFPALEKQAAPLGLHLNAEGLRQWARLLMERQKNLAPTKH